MKQASLCACFQKMQEAIRVKKMSHKTTFKISPQTNSNKTHTYEMDKVQMGSKLSIRIRTAQGTVISLPNKPMEQPSSVPVLPSRRSATIVVKKNGEFKIANDNSRKTCEEKSEVIT